MTEAKLKKINDVAARIRQQELVIADIQAQSKQRMFVWSDEKDEMAFINASRMKAEEKLKALKAEFAAL